MRLTLSILTFSVLSISFPAHSAEDLPGKLIFAVQLVETSEHRTVDGKEYPAERTGVFYYYQEAGWGGFPDNRPQLIGYRLQNGKVTDVAGNGEELLKELKALPLASFDVQKELDSTIAKGKAEAAKTTTGFPMLIVADGARYRILYDFNGVKIDHTAWNPAPFIRLYSPYSANLKNLCDLFDLFSLHYGRRQLQL